MNRQRALELPTRSKPELQARFGVTRPALRPHIEKERVNV